MGALNLSTLNPMRRIIRPGLIRLVPIVALVLLLLLSASLSFWLGHFLLLGAPGRPFNAACRGWISLAFVYLELSLWREFSLELFVLEGYFLLVVILGRSFSSHTLYSDFKPLPV